MNRRSFIVRLIAFLASVPILRMFAIIKDAPDIPSVWPSGDSPELLDTPVPVTLNPPVISNTDYDDLMISWLDKNGVGHFMVMTCASNKGAITASEVIQAIENTA